VAVPLPEQVIHHPVAQVAVVERQIAINRLAAEVAAVAIQAINPAVVEVRFGDRPLRS